MKRSELKNIIREVIEEERSIIREGELAVNNIDNLSKILGKKDPKKWQEEMKRYTDRYWTITNDKELDLKMRRISDKDERKSGQIFFTGKDKSGKRVNIYGPITKEKYEELSRKAERGHGKIVFSNTVELRSINELPDVSRNEVIFVYGKDIRGNTRFSKTDTKVFETFNKTDLGWMYESDIKMNF